MTKDLWTRFLGDWKTRWVTAIFWETVSANLCSLFVVICLVLTVTTLAKVLSLTPLYREEGSLRYVMSFAQSYPSSKWLDQNRSCPQSLLSKIHMLYYISFQKIVVPLADLQSQLFLRVRLWSWIIPASLKRIQFKISNRWVKMAPLIEDRGIGMTSKGIGNYWISEYLLNPWFVQNILEAVSTRISHGYQFVKSCKILMEIMVNKLIRADVKECQVP